MVTESNSPARPVEGRAWKRIYLWDTVRTILAVCGLVAIAASVLIAYAYVNRGQGPALEERKPEGQLFSTEPFRLGQGLAIVEMTHQGEGAYVVNLLSTEQEETGATPERIEFFGDENGGSNTQETLALADDAGSVDVSRAVRIQTAGEHVFDITADGPWTITVEQPHPSSAPQPASFSGGDDTATPFFQLSSGPKEITVTNPTQEEVEVSLLDKDGNEVERITGDEINQAGQDPPGTVSSTVDIPETGVYLFDVRADNLWTVEIADAG